MSKCTYVDCKTPAIVNVSGGLTPSERRTKAWTGWSGKYCRDHVLSCVDNQLFQVQTGLPILIEELK